MKALIIEDDELKLKRLSNFLLGEDAGFSIETARSYKSGLKALVGSVWTVVLMDMTMPSFDITPGTDGGRPLSLGGKELLRQMKRRGVSWATAVVSGFESFGAGADSTSLAQLDDELRAEFAAFYLGSVYFNATTDDWKDRLRVIVQPALLGAARL